MSPAWPGTMTSSASPSYAGPSGVTSDTSNVRRLANARSFGFARVFGLFGLFLRLFLLVVRLARKTLALLDSAVDRSDHVERLLRQLVVLALDDLLEAADRVL